MAFRRGTTRRMPARSRASSAELNGKGKPPVDSAWTPIWAIRTARKTAVTSTKNWKSAGCSKRSCPRTLWAGPDLTEIWKSLSILNSPRRLPDASRPADLRRPADLHRLTEREIVNFHVVAPDDAAQHSHTRNKS